MPTVRQMTATEPHPTTLMSVPELLQTLLRKANLSMDGAVEGIKTIDSITLKNQNKLQNVTPNTTSQQNSNLPSPKKESDKEEVSEVSELSETSDVESKRSSKLPINISRYKKTKVDKISKSNVTLPKDKVILKTRCVSADNFAPGTVEGESTGETSDSALSTTTDDDKPKSISRLKTPRRYTRRADNEVKLANRNYSSLNNMTSAKEVAASSKTSKSEGTIKTSEQKQVKPQRPFADITMGDNLDNQMSPRSHITEEIISNEGEEEQSEAGWNFLKKKYLGEDAD